MQRNGLNGDKAEVLGKGPWLKEHWATDMARGWRNRLQSHSILGTEPAATDSSESPVQSGNELCLGQGRRLHPRAMGASILVPRPLHAGQCPGYHSRPRGLHLGKTKRWSLWGKDARSALTMSSCGKSRRCREDSPVSRHLCKQLHLLVALLMASLNSFPAPKAHLHRLSTANLFSW
jgi:hypothetical protein